MQRAGRCIKQRPDSGTFFPGTRNYSEWASQFTPLPAPRSSRTGVSQSSRPKTRQDPPRPPSLALFPPRLSYANTALLVHPPPSQLTRPYSIRLSSLESLPRTPQYWSSVSGITPPAPSAIGSGSCIRQAVCPPGYCGDARSRGLPLLSLDLAASWPIPHLGHDAAWRCEMTLSHVVQYPADLYAKTLDGDSASSPGGCPGAFLHWIEAASQTFRACTVTCRSLATRRPEPLSPQSPQASLSFGHESWRASELVLIGASRITAFLIRVFNTAPDPVFWGLCPVALCGVDVPRDGRLLGSLWEVWGRGLMSPRG